MSKNKHRYLDNIADEVRQLFVHLDFLCVFLNERLKLLLFVSQVALLLLQDLCSQEIVVVESGNEGVRVVRVSWLNTHCRLVTLTVAHALDDRVCNHRYITTKENAQGYHHGRVC